MDELVSYTHSVKPAGEYMPGVPRFVYSVRPTGRKWYTPSAPKEPTTRRRYADIEVDVEHVGDGLALIGGTQQVRSRTGRRELVGAIKRLGGVYVRVHCHGCGETSEITLRSWRWADEHANASCPKCARKRCAIGTYGAHP